MLTGLFPPGPVNNLRTPTMPVTNTGKDTDEDTDEDRGLAELDPVIHAQPRLTVALAALPKAAPYPRDSRERRSAP